MMKKFFKKLMRSRLIFLPLIVIALMLTTIGNPITTGIGIALLLFCAFGWFIPQKPVHHVDSEDQLPEN